MNREFLIECAGGAIGPGPLRELARFAHQYRVEQIRITHRQGLAFRFPKFVDVDGRLPAGAQTLLFPEANILSSACAFVSGRSRSWLSESRILEVVRSLPKGPEEGARLSISVVEPSQSLVPLYASLINFVASPVAQHWELIWRTGETLHNAEVLAPTHLLPELASFLQEELKSLRPESSKKATNDADASALVQKLRATFAKGVLPKDAHLSNELQDARQFPAKKEHDARLDPNTFLSETNFEGFFKEQENYSIGIFKNNHSFSAVFLDELGYLCRKSEIGRIYLTPKHSLVVRNIPASELSEWQDLLARHNINLRHNQNELGIQLLGPEFRLRRYLISELDRHDLSLGLQSCAIDPSVSRSKSKDPHQGEHLPDASLLVRTTRSLLTGRRYLLYRKERKADAPSLRYAFLGGYPNRRLLARGFLEALRERRLFEASPRYAKTEPTARTQKRQNEPSGWRCPDCLYLYEEAHGDPLSRVPARTPWEKVPEGYECPVCAAPKDKFYKFTNSEKKNPSVHQGRKK